MYDKAKRRERYLRNKESIKLAERQHYAKFRESINTKRRASYLANIEIKREQNRIRATRYRNKFRAGPLCETTDNSTCK